MNEQVLKSGLKTRILGQQLYYFKRISSTNSEAKKRASTTVLQAGTTFIAAQQDNGKGTDGNQWHSSKGNLYLSIVFPFDDKITSLFPFYPAVALAKMLRRDYNIPAHVKWPNDVLVGHKKIAGILCEGLSGKYMIMGIGINTLQEVFPKEIENIATSIALECTKKIKIETLFCEFLEEYERLFYEPCNIQQAWLNHTQMIGKTITTMQDGIERSVKVSGLSPEGFLEVTNNKGDQEVWIARRGLDISTDY